MTREEQETVAVWNSLNETTFITTSHPPTWRKLLKKGYKPIKTNGVIGDGHAWFELPAKEFRWSVGKRVGRQLSEAHKARLQSGRISSQSPSNRDN